MQQYSLPQIEAFLAAVSDAEKGAQRLAMIAARAAQADKKGFQRMFKEFT